MTCNTAYRLQHTSSGYFLFIRICGKNGMDNKYDCKQNGINNIRRKE